MKNYLETLRAVLCDPDGRCCIRGSDEDRQLVDDALKAIASEHEECTALLATEQNLREENARLHRRVEQGKLIVRQDLVTLTERTTELLGVRTELYTLRQRIRNHLANRNFYSHKEFCEKLEELLQGEAEQAAEPVAWRAWFDADSGARWLFSLWPEEERLKVDWQALYTHPQPANQTAEPVMIYHGGCVIDCGEHGHQHVEMLKMIPAGSLLYAHPAPKQTEGPVALRLSEGLGAPRADFECEWTPSEKDNKLHELAKRYHEETEAYDRTVCTGPIVRGSIMPIGPHEAGLIKRNALQAFDRIVQDAARHDISRAELWHAVGRYGSLR